MLVALASSFGMAMKQLDVTTAYLNGSIDEEILMEPPHGLTNSLECIFQSEGYSKDLKQKATIMLDRLKIGNQVCLLKKSLYGLRQAGRNWHLKLDEVLRRFGAMPSKSDACVYQLGQGEESLLIAVYVDDILLVARDPGKFSKVCEYLAREFEIKDLGEPKYCLDIEFNRRGNEIALHQRGYIAEILERFGMTDCKPVSSPMDVNSKLSALMEDPSDDERKLPFRELVGALMYMAVATRPDIAHAVSSLSQFNNGFGQRHWTAAKRVLRYLKGTADIGLVYRPSNESLVGYVDADWAGCPIDRRSYTGYAFLLSNGVISWDSRKQRTVALSSTEAEFMGMSDAAKEAIYLRSFLFQLGFRKLADVKLLNDNLGALKLAKNHTFHSKTKHIDLRYHFIREAIRNEHFKVEYTPTEEMVADVMTKGLSGPKNRRFIELMGLGSI